MTKGDHLTNGSLVRAIDDELPESEAALVGAHLSACEECQQKYQELAMLSSRLDTLVGSIAVGAPFSERESLKKKLEQQAKRVIAAARTPEAVWRRFGWGMAIAATVAIGITFAPHAKHASTSDKPAQSESASNGTFEVEGETFIALPYSNADLPLSAPRIVQMRIPVSSLAAAGVTFEPVSQVSSVGESVLADVLLGIDGQPLGVHVASLE